MAKARKPGAPAAVAASAAPVLKRAVAKAGSSLPLRVAIPDEKAWTNETIVTRAQLRAALASRIDKEDTPKLRDRENTANQRIRYGLKSGKLCAMPSGDFAAPEALRWLYSLSVKRPHEYRSHPSIKFGRAAAFVRAADLENLKNLPKTIAECYERILAAEAANAAKDQTISALEAKLDAKASREPATPKKGAKIKTR